MGLKFYVWIFNAVALLFQAAILATSNIDVGAGGYSAGIKHFKQAEQPHPFFKSAYGYALFLTTGTSADATLGGGAGKQTEAKYNKGMATFTFAKGGLMYEASIGGQKFNFEPLASKK